MGGERVRLGGGETHCIGCGACSQDQRVHQEGPSSNAGRCGRAAAQWCSGCSVLRGGKRGQAGACIFACHSRGTGSAVQALSGWPGGCSPCAEAALPKQMGSPHGALGVALPVADAAGRERSGLEAGGQRLPGAQRRAGGKPTGRHRRHKPAFPLPWHATPLPSLPVAGGAVCRGRGGSGAVE